MRRSIVGLSKIVLKQECLCRMYCGAVLSLLLLGTAHTTTSQGFTSANDGWALPQPFSNDVGIHNTYFSELHEGIRNRWDPVLVMQTVGILWSPLMPSISRRLAVNPFQFLDIYSEYTRDCVATPEDHIRAVCTYRLHTSSRIMFTCLIYCPALSQRNLCVLHDDTGRKMTHRNFHLTDDP